MNPELYGDDLLEYDMDAEANDYAADDVDDMLDALIESDEEDYSERKKRGRRGRRGRGGAGQRPEQRCTRPISPGKARHALSSPRIAKPESRRST